MTDNPLSGKVGLDTTEFKAGATELARQIRVIESGFQAAAAGMGDWDKSSAGLELRIKALTDKIELQKQKISALQVEYKKLAADKGTNSRAAQDLEIKINKEIASFGKMQSELKQDQTALDGMGKESQEAAGKVEKLGKEEEKTTGASNRLAGVMKGLGSAVKIGAAAIAGMAASVAGMAVGVGALVLKTARASDNLVEMGLKTGLSTTRLQELQYISKQTGTDLETMTGSMARLVRSMDSAKNAGSPTANAFKELGIQVTDANGNLRDSRTVWEEAITALGKIPDETERDALSMQLFGKSAQELNPLILVGADGMAQMTDEAHRMGAVMSEENVQAASALNDKLDSLKMGAQGIVMTLAGALVPALSGAASGAQDFVKRLVEALGMMKTNPEAARQMLSSLVGDIIAQIPVLLKAGLAIIQGLISAIIAALPTLITAAVQIITSLIGFVVQNLPLLMQAAIQLVMALVNGILPQLPALLTAAIGMVVTLIQGIAGALPQLMAMVATILPQIIITLINALPTLIEAALQLIIALVQGLTTALPILIEYVPAIIEAVFNALITALPLIGQAAIQLVMALITGIIGMLPTLGSSAIRLINVLVEGIKNLLPTILSVGKSIVQGIWQGIQDNAAMFREKIQQFFQGIVDGIKKLLGISSPSLIFKGIGQNMALGLGEGFASSFARIEDEVNKAIGQLGNQGGLTIGGGAIFPAGMPKAGNSKYDNRVTNINIYGWQGDGASLAAEWARQQRLQELLA